MTAANQHSKITLQSITVDATGTKEVLLELREVLEDNECKFIVATKDDRFTVSHVVNKDPMFQESGTEYNLGEFTKVVWRKGGFYFHFSRYVLGDATTAAAKLDFIKDVNKELGAYYYKKLANGFYINSRGTLCKKDAVGTELVVDYIVVSRTEHNSYGWAYRHPERINNYPIPENRTVKPLTARAEVVINPPVMSFNKWLETDLEDLMSESEKARVSKSKANLDEDSEIRSRWMKERREVAIANQKRLVVWHKEKAKKIMDNEVFGEQLALI